MEDKIYNGFQIVQDLIKLRWVPEVIKSIDAGNKRYNDILRSIPDISNTELNRKLSVLAEKNVIEKSIFESGTDYSLQNFGKDLVHIFDHLECLEDKYFETSGTEKEVECNLGYRIT